MSVEQAEKGTKERRLAAPVRAEHGEHFALTESEIESGADHATGVAEGEGVRRDGHWRTAGAAPLASRESFARRIMTGGRR